MRKILGFSVDEWDALPWWQQTLYLEQISFDPEFNEDADNSQASGAERATSFDDLPD